MKRVLRTTLTLLTFLLPGAGSLATCHASHIPFAESDVRLPQAQISTAREAARWLERGKLPTPKQLELASGLRPRGNGIGLRWYFPDGVLLTNCALTDDGHLVIVCWGRQSEN